MVLKRRIVSKDTEDERMLKASLLRSDENDDDQSNNSSTTPNALIPFGESFDLDSFIQSILLWWQSMIRVLQGYVVNSFPGSAASPSSLSLIQSERLRLLREEILVPFDYQDSNHEATLRTLWDAAFPDTPSPSGTPMRSRAWKDMGWQGEDPATDFRGGGFFGLRNLVFLAQRRPVLFNALLHKTRGRRAAWEYPFAIAGVNLTYTLQDMLELRKEPLIPRGAAAHRFLDLLSSDPSAFDELYCLSFDLLDQRWVAAGVDYMGFNAVLKDAAAAIEAALRQLPSGTGASFTLLRKRLSLPPHDADEGSPL